MAQKYYELFTKTRQVKVLFIVALILP